MLSRFRALYAFLVALVMVFGGAPAEATNLYATSSTVNIREKPSTAARILTRVPYRAAVTYVKGPSNGWYLVRANGVTGYMAASLASAQAPAARVARARTYAYTGGRGYINSAGDWVPSPVRANSAPAGATAQCNDGTYSFSRSRRGTCSHHGGVRVWL